ncbi:MAG: conjugal transfer protein TraF, partial [Chlamydiae bacterium]|nr:conjugal transfer protein TraF [Chlamydiota bacterium]
LGSFLETPTSSYGIIAKRDYDTQKRNQFLEKLSKNHFLLVFFEGKNPFSAKAIEVAELFASTHQWKFKFVSLDGIGVEGLENFEQDKGISKFFRITSTPAMFVVEPTKQEAHPVGVGFLTVSELEKNIEIQLDQSFEENLPKENLGKENE